MRPLTLECFAQPAKLYKSMWVRSCGFDFTKLGDGQKVTRS
jgi:hypothetical protein